MNVHPSGLISLLELKLFRKLNLEAGKKILPYIINNAQTRLIIGRNSCYNVRRLLNIIQLYQQNSLKGMVIIIGWKKAFGHVEWDFSFFTPFRWATQGFVYLGILISPVLQKQYKTNFQCLLKCIHDNLERWTSLSLSMSGRISLIKMNILLRLFYQFQMIPILLNNNTIKTVNNWFRTFIWNCKRPWFKLEKLQSPLDQWGLAVSNIKLYQLTSHFRYLLERVQNDPHSVWLDIEAFNLGKPLTLASLPFIRNWKESGVADDNLIVKSTLKAWDMIKKWEKRSDVLLPITPIQINTDFLQEWHMIGFLCG